MQRHYVEGEREAWIEQIDVRLQTVEMVLMAAGYNLGLLDEPPFPRGEAKDISEG